MPKVLLIVLAMALSGCQSSAVTAAANLQALRDQAQANANLAMHTKQGQLQGEISQSNNANANSGSPDCSTWNNKYGNDRCSSQ
jgi:hypothetical protein